MRRRLLDLLALVVAGTGTLVRRFGRANVWPLRVFFLEKDPAEIAVGAPAPSFRLASASGGEVSLSDVLAPGVAAVLVFYRGAW